MTNYEKFKDEINEILIADGIVALKNGEPAYCIEHGCRHCEFLHHDSCRIKFLEWLFKEYVEPAPTLTSKERAFCEMVHCPQDYHLIRSCQGELYLKRKYYATPFYVDPDSFSFIKHDKLWSVDDLLKLEVRDYD